MLITNPYSPHKLFRISQRQTYLQILERSLQIHSYSPHWKWSPSSSASDDPHRLHVWGEASQVTRGLPVSLLSKVGSSRCWFWHGLQGARYSLRINTCERKWAEAGWAEKAIELRCRLNKCTQELSGEYWWWDCPSPGQMAVPLYPCLTQSPDAGSFRRWPWARWLSEVRHAGDTQQFSLFCWPVYVPQLDTKPFLGGFVSTRTTILLRLFLQEPYGFLSIPQGTMLNPGVGPHAWHTFPTPFTRLTPPSHSSDPIPRKARPPPLL